MTRFIKLPITEDLIAIDNIVGVRYEPPIEDSDYKIKPRILIDTKHCESLYVILCDSVKEALEVRKTITDEILNDDV